MGDEPPRIAPRDFAVSPERRADARRARIALAALSLALLALSLAPWLLFAGQPIRPGLRYAALALTVLSLLMLLRLGLVARKAERCVGDEGSVLRLAPEGVVVTGDAVIPWSAVSGVWARDAAPQLRARAQRTVTGALGRAMLRAGVNTADLTIGVADARLIADPSRRVHRFRPLPSGAVPGRVELPFGSQFGTAELLEALTALRRALPAEVPVRLAQGSLDYAEAWAGTADDVATIRARERERHPLG